MSAFIDDPSHLVTPVEDAWTDYLVREAELEQQVEATVVTWRLARDDMFLPIHPFYRTIDTRETDGYWKPRPLQWVTKPEDELACTHHGFDAEGRLVFARRRLYSQFVIFGDGYYDLLSGYHNEATGGRIIAEEERGGIRRGGVTRYHVDADGRITTTVRLNNEQPEPDGHYRLTETFAWDRDRLTDSYRQNFNLGQQPPGWARDLSAEQLAAMFRQVDGRLREFLPGRKHVHYGYAADGSLKRAVLLDVDTGKEKSELYSRDPSDSVESVAAELSTRLGKQLVKLLKATTDFRPLRHVALVYSAEHVHCGLPTRVLLSGSDDGDIDILDWESYPREAAWPPESRTGQKLESLHRRLLVVVESSPAYAADHAPRPYREVLWNASRHVYDALARKKRLVAEDFTIFPIDDHGDVDAAEDVRQSLPSDVANRVLAGMHQ
ncbi:hypothetical protein Mal4_53280 [Maioricimonas rarisocia]|uniref:Uncharacterized protein n=1 Tax=Maioricimonas rarisocia TaxID=2528026 RepID=A0A517ZEN9_9PLAN|nr:hypothetical protein [Maioricimonas rarisocia]QDU40965.1 hypothetical protein Mal4_53280 [Maioricimonas rarisocia]